MSMNGKISLKLEKNLLEQIYKFRDGSGIQKYEDAVNLADEEFISKAAELFENMSSLRGVQLEKLHTNQTADEFDFIV
jgi:hypothetical protein